MKGEIYIKNARTAEDCLSNVMFQLSNINGFMGAGLRENAAIKAECLLRDAQALVAAFEKEGK